MTALNLHKLMSDEEGYLRKLRVPDVDEQKLRAAREEIRAELRVAFANWQSFVRDADMFDATAKAAGVATDRLPAPKFRIQGSFAYFTANDCQFPPTQQIDMDDGVYLPLTFVMVNGRARPSVASRAYFALVEKALKQLCDRKGWKLNPNHPPKRTCVRVEIDSRLHIDLPLYAIRDSAFVSLAESVATAQFRKAAEIRDAEVLDEQVYRSLSGAEIILAHRERGWIESDPRRLETWFENAVELYPVVRPLSRAFKGLRDFHLRDGDLGSICIMAAIVDVVPALSRDLDPKRFDMALISVAAALAERMGRPVDNPGFPGDTDKRLCADWSPEFRGRVQALFRVAGERLRDAVNGTFHTGIAIGHAKEAFGDLVPNDENLISLGAVAATVRQTLPEPQPQPMVPRTKSG